MARTNKIRWKVGEKEQLAREVRNFNARRRRMIKKNPDLINYLPTLSYREIIKQITTRKDYNRILREINWSRAKNAFQIVNVGGAKTTKWDLRIAKSRLRAVNRQREAERKKAGVSTTKGTMGTIEQNNLRNKPFSIPKSQKEWEAFKKSLETQVQSSFVSQKDEIYRQNYISAFSQVYGTNYTSQLMQRFAKLNAYQISQAMYYSPILNIKFIYDDIDMTDGSSDTADLILETWDMYINSLSL